MRKLKIQQNMEELGRETITIDIEQLESLLENVEYAKEWKVKRFGKVFKENVELKEKNKELRRIIIANEKAKEFWDKEYMKIEEKAKQYRKKYLKWKMKTKGLREKECKRNGNRIKKVNKRKD